ncbi:DedA family protein [Candidatus Nomurabacteria bacterium]|nr:DedA family protein [Candidatus Nomurabacteria bacterium]
MDLPSILNYALGLTVTYKYLLLFIGVIIEGPVLMVAAGFLIHFGVFDVIPLYLVLIFGDIFADVIWYYIGKKFAEPVFRRHGKFLSVTPEMFEKVKHLFMRFHEKILIISKLTLGFGFAITTLLVAGATHVPFKKYLYLNILGEFILVAILLFFGYFFGEMYKYVADSLKAFFVAGVIIIVALSLYGFARYMKTKISNL